jgi:hypothetical protein
MRKVYHLHIPKTAGTTINTWLDDLVPFGRARSPYFPRKFNVFMQETFGIEKARSKPIVDRICAELYDVMHGHDNMLSGISDSVFIFSFFRDPVARAYAQYKDQSGLKPWDVSFHPQKEFLLSSQRSKSFLELHDQWKDLTMFKAGYRNAQCRMLVINQLSPKAFFSAPDDEIFDRAVEVVDKRLAFIGLQSAFSRSMNSLSRVLEACPVALRQSANVGRYKKDEMDAETREVLLSLNRADQRLFDYVVSKFNATTALDNDYLEDEFERSHAVDRVADLALRFRAGVMTYTMNDALVGDGFHGRDGAGTPDCCRWTGPGSRSILYLPAAKRGHMASIAVKGWMHYEVRDSLVIKVNGHPVDYSLRHGPGVADWVDFSPPPGGEFLKLEFEISRPWTDHDCGRELSDGRSKGFAIWKILFGPKDLVLAAADKVEPAQLLDADDD